MPDKYPVKLLCRCRNTYIANVNYSELCPSCYHQLNAIRFTLRAHFTHHVLYTHHLLCWYCSKQFALNKMLVLGLQRTPDGNLLTSKQSPKWQLLGRWSAKYSLTQMLLIKRLQVTLNTSNNSAVLAIAIDKFHDRWTHCCETCRLQWWVTQSQ